MRGFGQTAAGIRQKPETGKTDSRQKPGADKDWHQTEAGSRQQIRTEEYGRQEVVKMNTRERILSIRLAEAMKKQPEYAAGLRLRFVMKEPAAEARDLSDRTTENVRSDEACQMKHVNI
jgi:hypothetical protein